MDGHLAQPPPPTAPSWNITPPPIIIQQPCVATQSLVGIILQYARIIGIVLCAVAMLYGAIQFAAQHWGWRDISGQHLPPPGTLLIGGALGVMLMGVAPEVIGGFIAGGASVAGPGAHCAALAAWRVGSRTPR